MKPIKYLFFSFLLLLSSGLLGQHIILNKGIGGNNSNDLINRLERDVIAESPDLVIIMVGTNDVINSTKLISYDAYKQNYQSIIDTLKQKHVELVLMSPPPVDTGYVLKRHQRALYEQDLNFKLDALGSIIKKLAEDNRLYFIDLNTLFKIVGSPNRERSSLIINQANYGKEDGIHPTKDGYLLIAKTIFNYLVSNNLLDKNKKILCFGDSITYGSFMEGAGTANGYTYPAFLSRLISRNESDSK